MRPLILLLAACDFSASSTVLSVDSGRDSGTPQDADDSAGGQDSGDEPEVDQDGDGYTEEDGDCDDQDASIHPDQSDDCDGVDSDCDGELDEDAVDSDGYEPNDSEAWPLGTLSDEDSYSLQGSLHSDEDVDRFDFTIDDGVTNLFELQVGLDGIPDGAVFEVELSWMDEDEVIYADSGSDSLSTTYDDTSLVDESGTYQVQIRSLGGADCSESYTLSIVYTEWGW